MVQHSEKATIPSFWTLWWLAIGQWCKFADQSSPKFTMIPVELIGFVVLNPGVMR